MQRIDAVDCTRNGPDTQPQHINRSSASSSIVVATVAAMTTVLFMVRDPTMEPEHRITATAPNPSYASTFVPRIHSGPFKVDGFEHEVQFMDDGFTIAFPGRIFRIQRAKAFWSDLGLEKMKDIIGEHGVTHIDCNDGVCIYSGSERSLRINQSDFARILRAMNDPDAVTVTVDNVGYTLTMENGWSTILIPREGKSTLTFERQVPPSVTIAGTNDH